MVLFVPEAFRLISQKSVTAVTLPHSIMSGQVAEFLSIDSLE